MPNYDLAAMVRPSRRGSARLPAIMTPIATEMEMRAVLVRLTARVLTAANKTLIPALRDRRRAGRRYRDEASTISLEDWYRIIDVSAEEQQAFEALLAQYTSSATAQIAAISAATARRHTRQFIAAARRAFGVDLAGLVKQSDLAAVLRTAGLRNANLITKISGDLAADVKNHVLAAVSQGRSVRALTGDIKNTLDVGQSKAALIARDQTSKLNSDLTRFRQTQAGITRYEWSSVADRRVRPLHADIDGKVYRHGESTDAEGGQPPGQPILCRCVAIAIVDFD